MEWISVNERMPEAKQRVLAFYTNEYEKSRIETACYIPPRTVLVEDFLSEDAEGCEEYDEEKDCYWVVEGWWESSLESDENWMITNKVTHWMPLPKAPDSTESA